MAKIAYEGPDGTASEEVAAENITDSGKVQGVRIRLEDESFIHLPYTRVYWIRMSEEEGRVDYSSA
ncbi:hypothetical protein [Natrinema versiforme]|uniref:Prephenate dehydratase domain-containing protein n=1 Tax=Natrinema versiforme TaxID=88724 RepID=A0A4V1FZF9_9EURY|nr:hypothetical protein [Natrinema versiforme]QCS41706.1 hypothetical protein FEJ81_04810 [Natrinema versiforme]